MRFFKRIPVLGVSAWCLFFVMNGGCRKVSGVPDQPRVWVIGFDGATWRLIDPLIARGELPNFKRLKQKAAWTDLGTIAPTISPVVWTTMATGLPVSRHGVVGWEKNGHLLTSDWRRGVPFWEIADRLGYRTAVVNWWATYPATQLKHGFMVSDRFRNGVHDVTMARRPGMVYPPERGRRYESLFRFLTPRVVAQQMRHYGFPQYPRLKKAGSPVLNRAKAKERLIAVPTYLRQDLVTRAVVRDALDHDKTEMLAVIFRIIDIYSHMVLTVTRDIEPFEAAKKTLGLDVLRARGKDPAVQAQIAELDRQFADRIRPALGLADTILGEIMGYLDKKTYLIVVLDHGFIWRGEHLYDHEAFKGLPLADGLFAIRGPGVRPGRLKQPLTVYQIAPLVVGLLRAPISRELKGRFPFEPFRSAGVIRRGMTYVRGYKRTHRDVAVTAGEKKASESTTREDLRTLGYIQ